MKKSKLLIASVVVSFSLLAAPSMANPTENKPPLVETEEQLSFSDWFFGLFDF